jgi:HEAT repeat protein
MSEEKKIEKINHYAQKGNLKKLSHFCDSEDSELRCACAAALGSMGTEEARNMLISMINDPDLATKKAVVTSLGKIGDKGSTEYIRHAMEHSSDDGFMALCRDTIHQLMKA